MSLIKTNNQHLSWFNSFLNSHYKRNYFLKTNKDRETLANSIKQEGVSQCGLAIYILKYFNTKEKLWKLKYFTTQKYNLQKNPLKETKILQDIITL
jgi:hypothetical protein